MGIVYCGALAELLDNSARAPPEATNQASCGALSIIRRRYNKIALRAEKQ